MMNNEPKRVTYFGRECWLCITPKGNEYYSYGDAPPTAEDCVKADEDIAYAASIPVWDYDLDDSDSDGYGWERKALWGLR